MSSNLFKKKVRSALTVAALIFGGNFYAQLGLTWSEMGPNDVGGRCRSIVVDKTDASGNTLFAAGVSGGVFKSTDGGSHWAPINDQAACMIVSSMAQGVDGTLFVGTGETFGRGGDGAGLTAFVGVGLYKLSAGSSTFVVVKDSASFGNINEVACSKTNANVIYVASQKGMKISTDAGVTWVAASSSTIAAMDVKLDIAGGVYYSEGTVSSPNSNVYYSSTGGAGTFIDITPVITNRGRIEIATAPSDANFVYLSIANPYPVATGNTPGGLRALYISSNKGTTWSLITLGNSQFDPFVSATTGRGIGDYANTIAVSPSSPYFMLFGGYTAYYWSQSSSATLGQGSFNQIGIEFYFPQAAQYYMHPKLHDLKFSNGYAYAATDGGISRLQLGNFGGSILAYNNGFNTAQFNSVAMQNYPYTTSGSAAGTSVTTSGGVAGGTNGNALNYLPGNLINTKASVTYGFDNAYQADFSKILPNALFYAGPNGSIYRTIDIKVNPPATFYDNTYKTVVAGGPGAGGTFPFAFENTPMRLWENYGQYGAATSTAPVDSIIFLNTPIKTSFFNLNKTQSQFYATLTRPQRSAKYDSIYVVATSTKKIGQASVVNYSIANTVPMSTSLSVNNTNTVASTFTVNNTRPNTSLKYDSIFVRATTTKALGHPTISVITWTTAIATPSTQTTFTVATARPAVANLKYDSVIIKTTSFKMQNAPTPTVQTIRIKPAYTGTTVTGFIVLGANNSPTTNNVVFINPSLSDSIRFKFLVAPKDSANISVTIKYKYEQNLVIVPAYTGTSITSYTVYNEAVTTPTTNNMVFINTSGPDSIRFTPLITPDSCKFLVRAKYKAPVTFTFVNVRANVVSKYDSIVVKAVSSKLGGFKVPTQTITIVPAYTGSVITGYTVAGTSSTNNLVFINSNLSDSIRLTYNVPPSDSSTLFVRIKYKYWQNLTIVPGYVGNAITSYTVNGESSTSTATNNVVILKPTLTDSIRFTFKTVTDDSTTITTTAKLRYDVGSYVTMINDDITGVTQKDSSIITTQLYNWSNPPYRKIRLLKSARLAVGLNGCVVVLKRPLNFATSLDFIKLTGSNSRCDSNLKAKVLPHRGLVTKLEWSNNGKYIYFSSKFNDTTYYFYRISGLDFIGDSTSGDYSGRFTSDVDSSGNKPHKSIPVRLTPLGKFKYPVTSISVLSSDTAILVTTGSYSNNVGTVYYSNGNIKKAPVDSTYSLTNFTLKNGTGANALPIIPAYSSLFEMHDNKRVLIGTETGLYSTLDITAANPTWAKDNGTTSGSQLPNVPIFQIRQQTLPNWYQFGSSAATNSGMIYVATHGRGIWSTNKFFSPFNIGIDETVSSNKTFDTSMKLYPNPTSSDVNVWFNTISEGDYKLNVTDVSGRVVMQYNAGKLMEGEQIVPLNTSSLKSGIYFVNVIGNNGFNNVNKLIISR